MKFIVEKVICGSTLIDKYILRIKDADKVYNIEVNSKDWKNITKEMNV